MKYQLVLQFAGESQEDFDALIELEHQLTHALSEEADVDGHDIGSGQANIFILTDDPKSTFQSAKPVLEKAKRLSNATAAYRQVDGEDYRVIWPSGSRERFQVI